MQKKQKTKQNTNASPNPIHLLKPFFQKNFVFFFLKKRIIRKPDIRNVIYHLINRIRPYCARISVK